MINKKIISIIIVSILLAIILLNIPITAKEQNQKKPKDFVKFGIIYGETWYYKGWCMYPNPFVRIFIKYNDRLIGFTISGIRSKFIFIVPLEKDFTIIAKKFGYETAEFNIMLTKENPIKNLFIGQYIEYDL